MTAAEFNLGRHCGITFARIKPASLFTVREEDIKILAYFAAKFRTKGFVFVCMRRMGGRALFYVYHIGALEKLLCCPLNRKFLEERGYPCKSAAQSIRLLKERMQEDDFPHEIGIFLGYPLEDVQGFIDDPAAKTGLCGYWKVYADLEKNKKSLRDSEDVPTVSAKGCLRDIRSQRYFRSDETRKRVQNKNLTEV